MPDEGDSVVILGMYSGHDSHYCLIQDGQLTHHYHVDRFTRARHSAGFREAILMGMLKDAGLSWDNIDIVAVGGCRWDDVQSTTDLFSKLVVAERHFLNHTKGYNNPMHKALNQSPMERLTVDEVTWQGHTVKVYQLDHHLAHVAQAHYTGPFVNSLAFSFDGGGDGAFMLSCQGFGSQLSNLEYNDGFVWPHRPAIGNLWTLTVRDLYKFPGGSTDGEGKLMGHAAYGNPRSEYVSVVERMMRGGYGDRQMIPEEFERLRTQIPFDDFHSEKLKDYSASMQHVTEKLMHEVVNKRVRRDGLRQITLSGGCVYNCCSNGKLAKTYPYTFVSNSPNDGGLAVGAALFVWHHVLGNTFQGVPEFDPFKGGGTDGTDDLRVADRVVQDLLDGKLVAWFNGRAENGARALGHRSILADPRDRNIKEVINSRGKKREWFRPFAPSVLGGYEEWSDEKVPRSYYMSFAIQMKPQWVEDLPGVTHVDGTCRPQVVNRAANPLYWEIIDRFRQATGIPMILNTSFNVREPIIETTEQANKTFNSSGIDVLYIDGARREKK